MALTYYATLIEAQAAKVAAGGGEGHRVPSIGQIEEEFRGPGARNSVSVRDR
jgi:hypothetical protein